MTLRGYLCSVVGHEDHETPMNALSAGKARYQFWLNVQDCLPDLPITKIKVRSAGKPITTPAFEQVAEYRGVPFAHCGMKVEVGAKPGVIVGHNCSANFDVLFEDGRILNCHPLSEVRYFNTDGTEVAS